MSGDQQERDSKLFPSHAKAGERAAAPVTRTATEQEERDRKMFPSHAAPAQEKQSGSESADGSWDSRIEAWQKSWRADPEIGGAAYQEGIGLANGVLKEFGFKDDLLGKPIVLGSHPEFGRLLVKVAKALKAARGGKP